MMTEVQELARFVHAADYDRLSGDAAEQLKLRLLDTLGVAIGALDAPSLIAIRKLTAVLGGRGTATLIGGGASAPDRAAFYNTALSRYLDFMDSYLAPGETCHPSDNIGAVLAAAQHVDASGRDFLAALAVAYQVQVRLSDVAPVRARGFDHTVQGAYAVAAGAAKALGLPAEQIAHAIAISGTANNALRVTRTGGLSHWKGLAYPEVARAGTHAALLAAVGITGPAQVFEGNKGFKQSIAGDFDIDWANEDLEGVRRTIIKKHNAEIHSQTAIDAALELRRDNSFDVGAIASVQIDTFQVAFDIIGGGEEGDKHDIHTKEEADHSLPYMVAAALLDGAVEPAQYAPERIVADDIQLLLQRTNVAAKAEFTARFPAEMPSAVTVHLHNGEQLQAQAATYDGFVSQPLDRAGVFAKFQRLAAPFAGADLTQRIADVVLSLDERPVHELTTLLAEVEQTRRGSASAAA